MRAWEFHRLVQYESGSNAADISGGRKPPITLRYLNHLKLQRRQREAEFAKKRPLIAAMYGDPDRQAEAVKDEIEREEERHEIEMLKQEIDLLKDQIAVQIDAAEINAEQKERIAQGAMRAIARKRKNNARTREQGYGNC